MIIDQDTGEELCKIGVAFGDKVGVIQASPLKTVRAICNPGDPLILNTLAEEKLDFLAEATEYEAALLRLYARLRPGNPPQTEKAKDLFAEKFLDTNRYRLGRVGRFRVNRKFADDPQYKQVGETAQHLRAEDFLAVIRYIMELRRPADPNRRSRARNH